MDTLAEELIGGSSSSSSTSQTHASINLDAPRSGLTAENSTVTTRKRNRAIVVSDRYSQLVEYEVPPAELQSWVASAGVTRTYHETEAGRRLADFNILRVARSSVQSSDIGIAAVEEPDEDESRDMDFLASSNLIFFEFLGSPGAVAYVRCLGYLSDRVGAADLAHRRFKIESPTHFLVAAGDFAAIAARMRLEKPGNDRAGQTEPREKRQASGAQEAGGERTEGEKGGGYVLVTRDGVRLQIRDKSNLQARCDQLEFMWRAAERGLWKHMSGSGYKLQAEAYWKVIQEEAEALEQPIGSVFLRAGKVSLLNGTAIATSTKALEQFLIGGFGEAELSLDSFCAGSRLSTSAHPCVLQNAPLVSAVEALGVALEVLFSPHFAGVCDDLVEALRGHVRPLRLTDSGFLVHTIERTVTIFFRTVSKEDRALAFPGSDVTCPAGCAALLKAMLEETVLELTDVAKATVLEKMYTIRVMLKKERAAAMVPGVKGRSKVAIQEPEGEKGEVSQCGSHLGQLLKAVKKNGTPLKCLKGTSCKFKHGKLGDMTKAAAISLVATMPVWMQNSLSPLIASAKGFKS